MDRRHRKTQTAVFSAFLTLLSEKAFDKITVNEILEIADVSRATFYAHFESKDFLLKTLCEELFCHVFHGHDHEALGHQTLFDCDQPDEGILHLFHHLLKNDNNVLKLLTGTNNDLFLHYFKSEFRKYVADIQLSDYYKKDDHLPHSYWENYFVTTFVESIKWWVENGLKEKPEQMADYFIKVIAK